MSADVDALRATLAAARAAREAAQLVYSEASSASHAAECDYDAALRAVRAADPLYTVVAESMHSADLDSHGYDHEDWCRKVDRLQAALGRHGYVIARVPE